MISTLQFKKKRLVAGISYLLFLLYITLAANLLFFSSYRQGVRSVGYGTPDYNLVPLLTIKNYMKAADFINTSIVVSNIAGNVLVLMPLGFFLPLLFSRYLTFWKTLLFVIGTTLAVECLQFLFHVGSFDVDDLILNTIGGVIGFVVFKVGYWAFLRVGNH